MSNVIYKYMYALVSVEDYSETPLWPWFVNKKYK